jgi:hypothetical protein
MRSYYNHKTSFEDTSYVKSTELFKHIWNLKNKKRKFNIKLTSGPSWSKHHPIAAAQRVATYASKRNWKFWKVARKDCWTGDVSYSRSVATGSMQSWRENLNVCTQYHHASSLTNSHAIIQEFFLSRLKHRRLRIALSVKLGVVTIF